VLIITVVGGILLALLLDQPIFGQGIVRILVISPFFVMPPVAALVWKNMIMHPGYGVSADIAASSGSAGRLVRAISAAFDHHHRRLAVAALRDADPAHRAAIARRRAEGSRRNGRRRLPEPLLYLTLPHLARAITVVILIQTIFLLGVYAEILVTTGGGPGYASTNLPS
jgi:sorbitol/mannitol transport system permease protein